MGRRKIEIRAIKDDRNRSVTFLKRKGGLFKKAHELSVLCSVDVAVIIFGHNKKLYEFSSGDIHDTLRRHSYYGQPHEHKGPTDFKNKGGGDDDDDDDDDEVVSNVREDSLPPQHAGIPPHLQHHSSFQHIRPPHQASASPPMHNGMFPPRHMTPQPQPDSRPGSRNTIRRTSSNLVPMQHPHATPPPPQNGFAYVPNPPIYNPQAAQPMPPHRSPQPQYQPYPPQPTPPLPQQHQPVQPVQPPQYMHPQQRPASQPQVPRQDSLQPPPHNQPRRASPQPEQQTLRPPEPSPPQPPRMNSTKSRSIFTPIDEGGSELMKHFFGESSVKKEPFKKELSPEFRAPPRSVTNHAAVSQPVPQPARPQSTPNEFPPPQRTNTSGSKSGARPKLNLQIPDASDTESAVGGSPTTHQSATASANPANRERVLPPPSPSANAVLSAGASGPGNPFARPPPPTSQQNRDAYNDNRNKMETPTSALPSRFMSNDSLGLSPSLFYGDWGDFGRSSGGLNSAVLPSPLTFQTPGDAKVPFGRENSGQAEAEKRKSEGVEGGDMKRIRT